jgi:hypothetical protein
MAVMVLGSQWIYANMYDESPVLWLTLALINRVLGRTDTYHLVRSHAWSSAKLWRQAESNARSWHGPREFSWHASTPSPKIFETQDLMLRRVCQHVKQSKSYSKHAKQCFDKASTHDMT